MDVVRHPDQKGSPVDNLIQPIQTKAWSWSHGRLLTLSVINCPLPCCDKGKLPYTGIMVATAWRLHGAGLAAIECAAISQPHLYTTCGSKLSSRFREAQ